MAEDSDKPLGRGRGGRGHLILEALKYTSRQPGTQSATMSSEESSNVPGGTSSGYASNISSGGTGVRSSEISSSASGSSGGRGALLARYIQQHKQKRDSGEITVKMPSKGRGDLLKSLSQGAYCKSEVESGRKSLSDEMSRMSISSEEVEPSPVVRQGKAGTRFEASSNWIPIKLDPNKAVFEYHVDYNPPVDSNKLRFFLMNSVRGEIGNVKSFDGAKLWLPIKLPNEVTMLDAHSQHSNEDFKIIITFKRRTSLAKSTQLYNILFNRVMKTLRYHLVGRSYFSPMESMLVPQHKLEIWPGFVTSAQVREGGVMLCADVSHRVLRTTTVYQVMGEIARCGRGNFEQAAIKDLVGSVVLTRYNNKCYRIDDILFKSNPQSTFSSTRGEVTYLDYYEKAHNIKIADKNQPLLLHKAKKKDLKSKDEERMICLIPELCYMTGLTDEMKSDFRVMKDLAVHTRLTPTNRQACLRKFIRNVNDNSEAKQILDDWGLTLFDDCTQIEGRISCPEKIEFGGDREIEGTLNADWSREACREKVIQPVDVQPHLWLVISTRRDGDKARKFVETYRNVTRSMGIFVGEPIVVCLSNDSIETYTQSIRNNYHEKLQLAVIIFPTQREDRYSAVKRLAYSELGLSSQCINARTISQDAKLRSVTQKVALQINCKLGGQLWSLKIPISGLMVCGMDVYHDPIRRGNSVVGFVGSLNAKLTKWFSYALFQNPGEEIVNGIKVALLETLKRYYEEHHSLPKVIIFYRDGVSDGQLKMIQDHEIPQITSIFKNFDSYEPRFYFVVVQKRINTRIFASLNGRGMENPPPGSIVDHTITKRDYYDFLLVSQHVRQGTVTPTHYVVLCGPDSLQPDHMQRLTFKLTHLYYNWPGTVRVPAPCQYAHKLAYLVGQNVRKPIHPKLHDKLYFL